MNAVRIAVAAALCGIVFALPAHAERDFHEDFPQLRAAPAKPSSRQPLQKKIEPDPAAVERTQQYDAILTAPRAKKYKVPEQYLPQVVHFSGYRAGTVVIDTKAKFLYLVEGWGKARRYGIAVGQDGLEFKGRAIIRDKQEWPRWIPTKSMIERQPDKYARYKDGMDGGPENPLGARALYLYQGNVDTHIRIHGTNQPWTIGSASSNGCFRMINEHVIDLYGRVPLGAEVVVL